jgi:FkbM family methyltransferase
MVMTLEPPGGGAPAPGERRETAATERSLFFSRWRYYLSSIPTLLLRIRNWTTVLAVFLGVPVKKPFTIELRDGGRYRARSKMEVWIIKETCIDQDYERGATPIQDGWTVVDIGAGAGDFAISAARRFPRSRVFAFEPFAGSFELMRENLALNGVSNVVPFPEAVAGRSGHLYLSTPTGIEGQHRTADSAVEAAVPVPAVTLGQVFEANAIGICDFLKIDCEGGEYDILFQAGTDALGRIRHIAMEYHEGVTPFSHRDLVAFLEEQGFTTTRRPSPAHPNLGFLFAANRRLAV